MEERYTLLAENDVTNIAELAEKKGCSANNIAASWTLNQSFPSFALIGPRTINELDTTLPCLDIILTKEEMNWLNLS